MADTSFQAYVRTLLYIIGEVYLEQVGIELIAIGLEDSELYRKRRLEIDEQGQLIKLILPEHARYVELGRRKGARMPPTSAILRWLKKKQIRGRDKRGRFITDIRLAFIISRAIARNGIIRG